MCVSLLAAYRLPDTTMDIDKTLDDIIKVSAILLFEDMGLHRQPPLTLRSLSAAVAAGAETVVEAHAADVVCSRCVCA